ncbi:MAG: GHMP kinase, partial [Planctomycetota bacterium]
PSREDTRSQVVKWSLRDLGARDQHTDLKVASMLLRADPRDRWTAYVIGCLLLLCEAKGVRPQRGFSLLLSSDVPEGKGVSSSAAIEVATMRALSDFYGIELTGRELALLCQRVENEIAGAPCGVMDQMTAACGKQDQLLALRCQPCELEGHVALPDDMEVVGIDSGVRHANTESSYGDVRAAAAMGQRMLLDVRGVPVRLDAGLRWGEGDPWRGYLANCDVGEFRARYDLQLPTSLLGAEFEARFGGHGDAQAKVDAQRHYPVRAATRHPVEENARAERFRELLLQPGDLGDNERRELGDLMFESHESYTACGLGHATTDFLVEQVRTRRERGAQIYGARVTGGGSGGTVAILGKRVAVWHESLRIKKALLEATGHSAVIFRYSSSGAMPFGTLRLEPKKVQGT